MKQQFFILTVTIPIEDNFETIIKMLKFSSYEKAYMPSSTSVHMIEYKFGPLTIESVELHKNLFKTIFRASPFKDRCTFITSEITN